MCNTSDIGFFINNIDCDEFKGKSVIEVGSLYVNGSVRPLIEKFCKPKEYIGVDISYGKFVDKIVPAEKLVEAFGKDRFDVVISTEMLEHVKDWKTVINNMKEILKPNGYIYITTRSKGFGYHAAPYDFWRYELSDMKKIFSDFDILRLENDVEPGVFLKAQKPLKRISKNLNKVKLYSMLINKKVDFIPEKMSILIKFKIKLKAFAITIIIIGGKILST